MPPSGAARRPPARASAATRADSAAALVRRGAELLRRLRDKDVYGIFREPVPDSVQGYRSVVEKPMDLRTCVADLRAGRIATVDELYVAVSLIWSNAMLFNQPDTIYYKQAERLRDVSSRMFEDLRRALDRDHATVMDGNENPSNGISGSAGISRLPGASSSASSDTFDIVARAVSGAGSDSGHRRRRKPPRLPKSSSKQGAVGAPPDTASAEVEDYAAALTVTGHKPPLPPALTCRPNPRDANVARDAVPTAPMAEWADVVSDDGAVLPCSERPGISLSDRSVPLQELYVGPPTTASLQHEMETKRRPRRVVYEDLYGKYIAASAPCARRLLAALLDPRVVLAHDGLQEVKYRDVNNQTPIPKPAIPNGVCFEAKPSSSLGPVLGSDVDTIFDVQASNQNKIGEELNYATLATGSRNGFVPGLSSLKLENKTYVGRTDSRSMQSFGIKKESLLSPTTVESVTCMPSEKQGLSSWEEERSGSRQELESESRIDLDLKSGIGTISTWDTGTACRKRPAAGTPDPPNRVKRVRFAVPPREPSGRMQMGDDAFSRLRHLVGDNLAQDAMNGGYPLNRDNYELPTSESLTVVAELLKEHKIDSSFLDCYKLRQHVSSEVVASGLTNDSVVSSISGHGVSVQNALAANHEILMNLRRLRANAEGVDSTQRKELLSLEREYSRHLANSIVSVVGKLPPQTLAHPSDIANAALTFAGSTYNARRPNALACETSEPKQVMRYPHTDLAKNGAVLSGALDPLNARKPG